jgi:hypothetical protein
MTFKIDESMSSLPTLGSVWSVAGVPGGTALVIAGPFGPPGAVREFLVAPLYTGSEPGFSWTDWDVLIRPEESPFNTPRYAAVWNVRPVLEYDLELQLGDVTSQAASVVRDVYWASLNEQKLGPDPRLGRPLRSWKSREAAFQKAELELWKVVSGRVIAAAPEEAGEELKHRNWAALGNVTVSVQAGAVQMTDAVQGTVLQSAPAEVYDFLLPVASTQFAGQVMVRLFIRAGGANRHLVLPIAEPRLLPVRRVPLCRIETLRRESNRLASVFSMEAT